MHPVRGYPWVAVVVILAILSVGAQQALRPAPAFELELFDGKIFRLAELKGKSPVLVWFWAPW